MARGNDAAMNYVESKMVNASGKMAKLLGTDLFLDGQGTNSATINLDGMQAALDNGNGIAVVKSGYMRETPSMLEYAKAA